MPPMDLNPKDTVPPEKRAGELVCKRCGAKINPATGKCTDKSCGLIQRPDIPPADKTSQSKTTRFSPTGQPDAKHQRAKEAPSVTPQYICPNCGTNVSTARGHCPNQKGCGYSGDMTPRGMQQPTANTEPKAMSQPAKSFLNEIKHESATVEHHTPTTRSPILEEIDRSEIKGRGFPKGEKREKPLKSKAYSESREWQFPSMERFRKPVLASLKLIGVAAVIALVVFLGGKYLIPAASQFVSKSNQPPSQPQTLTPIPTPSKGYTLNISQNGGGSITREPEKESYALDTQVTLTAKPVSGYSFDRWSGDIPSDTRPTSDKIHITMNANKVITAHFVDKVAPIISEVEVADIVDMSATVIWTTSKSATGYVEYGKTESLGGTVQSTSGKATDHIARLTNLAPSTKYYLKVRSKDQAGNDASPQTATFTTSSAIPIGNEIGKRAPNFTLPSYRDDSPDSPNNPNSANWKETISLSDLRGKTVIVNFWSSYCGACLLEFPIIRDVYQKIEWANMNKNPELALITVCIDGRDDRIPKIEDKFGNQVGRFTFPILLDKEDIINKGILIDNARFNIQATPTTIFIDAEGIIRYIEVGAFETIDEVKSILDSL